MFKSDDKDLEKLQSIERRKLFAEREFWSNCVQDLLDEGMSASEVDRAIQLADILLAARKTRFPE